MKRKCGTCKVWRTKCRGCHGGPLEDKETGDNPKVPGVHVLQEPTPRKDENKAGILKRTKENADPVLLKAGGKEDQLVWSNTSKEGAYYETSGVLEKSSPEGVTPSTILATL